MIERLIIWLLFYDEYELGYAEGDGNVGMTYYNSTNSFKSIAYDMGRTKRRVQLGLD